MNRAERYATILVFVVLLGSTLFFTIALYLTSIHNYEIVSITTVSKMADGKTLAVLSGSLLDVYPYASWKTVVLGNGNSSFNSFDSAEVIQWAIEYTNDNTVFIRAGDYILTHGFFSGNSNTTIIGETP